MDTVWESSEVLRQFMDLGPGIQSSFLDSLRHTRFYREEENVANELQNLRLSLRQEFDQFMTEPVATDNDQSSEREEVYGSVHPKVGQKKTDNVDDMLRGFAKPGVSREAKVTPALGSQTRPAEVSRQPEPAPKQVSSQPAPSPRPQQPADEDDAIELVRAKTAARPVAEERKAPEAAAAPQQQQRVPSARPTTSTRLASSVRPTSSTSQGRPASGARPTSSASHASAPAAAEPEESAEAAAGVPAWMLEDD